MARCNHRERAKLGEANAIEKIVACEVAFDGTASGIKLSKTALFCRFDNQPGSH